MGNRTEYIMNGSAVGVIIRYGKPSATLCAQKYLYARNKSEVTPDELMKCGNQPADISMIRPSID